MLHMSDVEGYIASCALKNIFCSCVNLCASLFDFDTQAARSSQLQPTTVRGFVITATQAAKAYLHCISRRPILLLAFYPHRYQGDIYKAVVHQNVDHPPHHLRSAAHHLHVREQGSERRRAHASRLGLLGEFSRHKYNAETKY